MKRRLSYFNSLCLIVMGISLSAHADIDPSRVAEQLGKNITAAFNAAEEESKTAASNDAFEVFSVVPALAAFASPVIAVLANFDNLSFLKILEEIFNESNITEKNQFNITYSFNDKFCELFNKDDSFLYSLCKNVTSAKIARMSVYSEDNLRYEIKIEGKLDGEDSPFVTLKSFTSSPNTLGGSLNLSAISDCLQKIAEAYPEIGEGILKIVTKMSGKITSNFSFTTPEQKASCAYDAKACLSFNIVEPISAVLFEGEINLKYWESSPVKNETLRFFSLENAVLRAEINSGAIELDVPLFKGALKHNRLTGSLVINASAQNKMSSQETPKILVENLCLEQGENYFKVRDKNFFLTECLKVDLFKFWEDKESSFIALSPFKFVFEMIKNDRIKLCSFIENFTLCIGDNNSDLNIFTIEHSNTNTDIRVPQAESEFGILALCRNFIIAKKAFQNSIGIKMGSLQASYEYALKMFGLDKVKLGSGEIKAREGDYLTRCENY